MKLLLFATVAEGHQLILHVRAIVHEALRRGWEPHLVVPEAAVAHPSFKVLQDDFGDKLPFSTMPSPVYKYSGKFLRRLIGLFGADFKHRKAFGEGFQTLPAGYKPDLIYFLNLDHTDLSISLKGSPFGDVPFSGMMFGKMFHYAEMGIPVPLAKTDRTFYEPLFKRLLKIKSLKSMAIIDPLLIKHLEKVKWPGWEKVTFVPDIGRLQIFSRENSIRKEMGIPEDRFLIMNFGWLHPRKGIYELVDAMESSEWPENASALFVGSMRPEAKELIETDRVRKLVAEGKLFLRTGFADDEVEGKCFAACDVVWLGYRKHWGMSGVLVQACLSGKPVISLDEGLISWYTKEYGVGEIVDITQPSSICRAVQSLMSDKKLYWQYQENCLKIGKLHAPGTFERAICDMLVIAIDIPLGQLSGGGRECDPAARRLIGRRRSSVFPVPFREALMGATRSEADARSRALGGPGVPAQTFGLFPKIVELRSLMLRAPSIAAKLFEIHPEVSFWAMNGGSDLDFPKKHEFGKLQRRQLLTAEFGADLDERITALGVISSAVAWDDVYDAFAAAWTAKRIALGKAERVTPLLQVDESLDHIVNIWY
ncbi:MAG: DUF429 domain-containing protein [Armatimonadetes bacterium]|nr:DUF429 domain-containing protein [Armatimonadota bacterium]